MTTNAPHNFYGLLDRRTGGIVLSIVGPDALDKTRTAANGHPLTGYVSVVALDARGCPISNTNLR